MRTAARGYDIKKLVINFTAAYGQSSSETFAKSLVDVHSSVEAPRMPATYSNAALVLVRIQAQSRWVVLTDIDVGQHDAGRSGRLLSKSGRATTTVDCLGLGHGSSIVEVSKVM